MEQRFLEQWFFRITDYAERLLANLDDKSKMDWSDTTSIAQRNWIGRSEGAELTFEVDWAPEDTITVFTTRPDTVFGATFLVLAPEHPLVERLTTRSTAKAVEAYRRAAASQGPGVAQGRRAREDRRLHRDVRDEPGDRRAHPDLDRRLRADGVRHRRHHGGAGAR